MRRPLILSLVLATAACAATPADDDQAILDAMVAHLAPGGSAGGLSACVSLRTDAAATVRQVITDGVHPQEPWIPIAPGVARGSTFVDPALSRAAAAALRAPRPARPLLPPGGRLPPPLRAGGLGADCDNAFTLSTPSVQGDLGLVEVVNFCGQDCFSGDLYALRRERGGWRPYALLPLWVS